MSKPWNIALTLLGTLALATLALPGHAAPKKKAASKRSSAKVKTAAAVAAGAAVAATASAKSDAPTTAVTTSDPTTTSAATATTPPANSPAALWVSSTTTETLEGSIRAEGWNAIRFPFEGVIYKMERIEMESTFGKYYIAQPVEGSERPFDSEVMVQVRDRILNPKTYSRPLTPEDECTTNTPSLGMRFRSDKGILRIQITPECNELEIFGFNAGDEPVGSIRLGYGPGRADLLEVLRKPAEGLVDEHHLR